MSNKSPYAPIDKSGMWWLEGRKGWMEASAAPQTKPEHADPIVVCGVGRSGTSMVAGLMQALGVFWGWRFTPPDDNNPTGYWEDRDYVNVYSGIISDLVPGGKAAVVFEYNGLLRLSMGCRWGWKHDTRVRGCLPFFAELYPNMKMVWIVRPLHEVLQRWERIWDYEDPEATIKDILAEIKLNQDRVDTLVIPFHGMRRYPLKWIMRLCKFAELDPPDRGIAAAVNFINPEQDVEKTISETENPVFLRTT